LNSIIDDSDNLTGPPPFQLKELEIGHENLEFFYRDVLECIQSLYGNPEFLQDLVFAPERHYSNDERSVRIINEMHTGDWWWALQVCNVIYI
jgi:hypothetical protein